MAKRWRSMDDTERAEYVARLDAVTDGMVAAFGAGTDAGDELWARFVAYTFSVGDVLDPRNMVRAFTQHVRIGNAKPTDLRTWSEWTKVGRTPKPKADVIVMTGFPSHLWDVADTVVTDAKAWRKAPAKPRRADGARVAHAVMDMVWGAHAVDLSASLPPLEAPADVLEDQPTPRQRETARMRGEGRTGTFDAMARAEFGEWADRLYVQAEDATRGHMLSPKGKTKGIDPKDFFPGNPTVIRAYASEELMTWFTSRGGIPTLKRYVSDMLGETTAQRRA